MNNDEAKFRLSAYRPGGDDASDPAMNEALDQARRDPALGAWLERERAFDSAVADKLGRIAPPPGLRDAILSGARMSSRRSWWRNPTWIAVAASVAVVLGATFATLRHRAAVGGLPEGLVQLALQDMQHGQHQGFTDALAPFQKPLGNPAAVLAKGMPFDPAKLADANCRSIDFHGHKVFELCFVRGGLEFHLYVLPSDALRASEGPIYATSGPLSTAIWTDAHHAYVLAGKLGVAALEKVIVGS